MSVKVVGIVKNLKKMNPWITLLYLFAAAFLFFGMFRSHSSLDASKTLNALPKRDRDSLDCLFRFLNHSSCSYVLFGNKPISISSFLILEPNDHDRDPLKNLRDLSNRLCVQNLKLNRGWEVWEKYKQFFPSSNCILLENRDSECVTLVMINKRNFLKITEENIGLFREILGDHVTPHVILESCLKSNNIIKDVLKMMMAYSEYC